MTSTGEPIIEARGLTTRFHTAEGVATAVDGVTVTLAAGESLGIVGESGSGKSVLVRSLMGLLTDRNVETAGSVQFAGVDLVAVPTRAKRHLWGGRIAMVFQDATTSLDPLMTIGRQITETLKRHGVSSGAAARSKAVELLAGVRIPDPARRAKQYPHEMSGGMLQRVSIAVALSCGPTVLLADEPTTALDVTVQAQILELLDTLRADRGMSLVLVTHDLGVAAAHTDRIAVMYAGQIVEEASTAELFANMLHPYTRLLFESIPLIGNEPGAALGGIPGRPPSLVDPPTGCRFADRCPSAQAKCAEVAPPLVASPTAPHSYRCWFPIGDVGTTSTSTTVLPAPKRQAS